MSRLRIDILITIWVFVVGAVGLVAVASIGAFPWWMAIMFGVWGLAVALNAFITGIEVADQRAGAR